MDKIYRTRIKRKDNGALLYDIRWAESEGFPDIVYPPLCTARDIIFETVGENPAPQKSEGV